MSPVTNNDREPGRRSCAPGLDLRMHPRVGARDAILERVPWAPTDRIDPLVAEVAGLHANGTLHVFDPNPLSGYLGDGLDQLPNRHILRAADVRRTNQRGFREPIDAVDHVVHIGIGPNGRPITPHLDGAAVRRLGHLATDGGGRLFSTARPRALWTVTVLESRNPHLDAVLAAKRHSDPLGIELFPPVLVIREGWVRPILGKLRLAGLHITVDTH